jgi:hypothetical protein
MYDARWFLDTDLSVRARTLTAAVDAYDAAYDEACDFEGIQNSGSKDDEAAAATAPKRKTTTAAATASRG